MNLPEVGVGLSWVSGLESVVEANTGLIDVLEVEPQGLLRRSEIDLSSLAALEQRRVPKLVHSVSFPVGGTLAPSPTELAPLATLVHKLGAAWISEHLAFQRASDAAGSWNAGMLLPPRQTLAGVDAAARSIRAFAGCMLSPLAVETGVNYLRPQADELPDGEFVARVAEAADCGILLDLHNVWTNDRNGRQSIGDFVEQLPLDRVWEVHLSGGHFRRGYWLDSHSGTVPLDLLELAARIVPRLPSLKAIIFELAPSSLHKIGETAVRMQLEALHRLWDRRNTASIPEAPLRSEPAAYDPSPSPAEWESTLAGLTAQKPPRSSLAIDLLVDPGLRVLRETVDRSRAAMIVHTLRLTSRLIMLERGTAYFEQLLAQFWKSRTPAFLPIDEAQAFAAFLRENNPYVPFLKEILDYDCAVLAVSVDGEERSISFSADPMPLLSALGAGRRPTEVPSGEFEIRLTPDQAAQAANLSDISWMH
ncbi:MAG TPA: DUF692 family protein [Terriglobales bacterium]|nr:DUF692 family protein [Terriglobales bacterium]